jgi:hypothetical protein
MNRGTNTQLQGHYRIQANVFNTLLHVFDVFHINLEFIIQLVCGRLYHRSPVACLHFFQKKEAGMHD